MPTGLRDGGLAIRAPRHWPRARWLVVAAAFALSCAWLYSVSALGQADDVLRNTPVTPPLWAWPIGVLGAAAFSALVATLWLAPLGARPTLCDLRWPGFGLAGLLLAVGSGSSGFVATVFGGAPASAMAVTQPVVGLASLAVLGWALSERLAAERRALDPAVDDDAACTTCRPLY